MRRLVGTLLVIMLILAPALATSEDMEQLASSISGEIRNNLLTVEATVAYVGMDGARAYLVGDISPLRTGQNVMFFRHGAAILSSDSPPQVVGRESLQVGQGKISALHDRTAWVQLDVSGRGVVGKGDFALVQLNAPVIHVAPFYVDEGAGKPVQDGRGRILRSLLMYNLKRSGFTVLDAPLLESEVDAAGLPTPAALGHFDTDGVLLIGRIMPKPATPDELIVGVAIFDLNTRDMRLARSYEGRSLAAFVPPGAMVKKWREMQEATQPVSVAPPAMDGQVPNLPGTARQQIRPPPPAVSKEEPPVREPVDRLAGVFRMHVATPIRLEWPPKTPGDFLVAELLAPTLPDIAIEWIPDTAAEWRIRLPAPLSSPFVINAREIVKLLTLRSEDPEAKSLIGGCRWRVITEEEIGLTLERPLADIRDRLADPVFRLINEKYEPLGVGAGPYRIATQGARSLILEKVPAARLMGLWAQAPDTIVLTIERDPNKRTKGYDDGEVDAHEILDEESMRFGPGTGSRTIQGTPEELIAVGFNIRRAPMSNVHFRRMIAMMVDRKTVLEVSLNQRGVPAENLLPLASKDVASLLVKLPERLPLAAQVLAKEFSGAGKLSMIFPMEEPHYGLIAESIRSDVASLNVVIEPQGLSWRAYVDRLASGEYELALLSIPYQAPFRLWAQQMFSSKGKNNRWGYRNSIVDTLLGETGDLGAALDLIHSDVPMVPLFWLSRRIVLGPRVADAWPSPSASKFLSSVRLK